MSASYPLRVAVMVNGALEYQSNVENSFLTSIKTVVPSAAVDFYYPIIGGAYPDVAAYDLLVLSGGTVDPTSKVPWVLKMQEFLRKTIEEYPHKKILGICWGHQTIAIAFGGVVGNAVEPEIGVYTIPLTLPGRVFFRTLPNCSTYEIMEYHAREVKSPGEGFIALAERNQCFINANNTILTFQGHPEIGKEFARKLLPRIPSYMGVDEGNMEKIAVELERRHDGLAIWQSVVDWVNETRN